MPLPRRVVSTSASRTLGIDNLPVHEIRLIQVLQDSSYDWCLRQIAAGKNCYLEMFRSRQEAFFSTALHWHLRDSRIDFSQVLQAVAASNNMPCDLTVWENRKMASAKLTQVVGDYMISMVGSNVTEHLTERLRVLETENAQLRASQINPTQQDAADSQPEAEIGSEAPPADESGTRTPCRTTSSQMNLRSPLQPGLHKPPAPTKTTHVYTYTTHQTTPEYPTATPIWHHTTDTSQAGGEYASRILLQSFGVRRTQQPSDSVHQRVDEDQDPWCRHSRKTRRTCQEAWRTTQSVTPWSTTKHQSLLGGMGHGTNQGIQIQTSWSHQTPVHFARDSAMTMWTLQQYHHAHQLHFPRKG